MWMVSTQLTGYLTNVVFASLYVGSLYCWKEWRRGDRNDPRVLFRRTISIVIASILCVVIILQMYSPFPDALMDPNRTVAEALALLPNQAISFLKPHLHDLRGALHALNSEDLLQDHISVLQEAHPGPTFMEWLHLSCWPQLTSITIALLITSLPYLGTFTYLILDRVYSRAMFYEETLLRRIIRSQHSPESSSSTSTPPSDMLFPSSPPLITPSTLWQSLYQHGTAEVSTLTLSSLYYPYIEDLPEAVTVFLGSLPPTPREIIQKVPYIGNMVPITPDTDNVSAQSSSSSSSLPLSNPNRPLPPSESALLVRNHIIAPVSEELVFRACSTATLIAAGAGYRQCICIGPLCFALAHAHHLIDMVNAKGMSVGSAVVAVGAQLGYTSLFAMYACLIMFYTESLQAAIAAHMLCNIMELPLITSKINITGLEGRVAQAIKTIHNKHKDTRESGEGVGEADDEDMEEMDVVSMVGMMNKIIIGMHIAGACGFALMLYYIS
jgi:membrane protein implicated in regulation of membrane protease activity